jgi:hypothetical protein
MLVDVFAVLFDRRCLLMVVTNGVAADRNAG